jgi:hypothetical protein
MSMNRHTASDWARVDYPTLDALIDAAWKPPICTCGRELRPFYAAGIGGAILHHRLWATSRIAANKVFDGSTTLTHDVVERLDDPWPCHTTERRYRGTCKAPKQEGRK